MGKLIEFGPETLDRLDKRGGDFKDILLTLLDKANKGFGVLCETRDLLREVRDLLKERQTPAPSTETEEENAKTVFELEPEKTWADERNWDEKASYMRAYMKIRSGERMRLTGSPRDKDKKPEKVYEVFKEKKRLYEDVAKACTDERLTSLRKFRHEGDAVIGEAMLAGTAICLLEDCGDKDKVEDFIVNFCTKERGPEANLRQRILCNEFQEDERQIYVEATKVLLLNSPKNE